MEWLVTIVIIAPAIWLAFKGSGWLLDYAIFVLAFNRGIRRLVDYYFNGQFNPYSPISLTPLAVAGLLLIPAVTYWGWLSQRARGPFLLLGAGLCLGLSVGIFLNRFAAVYSLAEWISGLAAMAFAAAHPARNAVADRWIKSAGWAAVAVAAYGWWQYYMIPAWDAMWLVESGMVGYMGQPEPTQMTVFSTLNERGPCGTFLAWAVIPMIIHSRWRNVGGWLSVALLLSGIVLTQTRSNLIIIALVALLYPALSKGRGLGRLLVLSALVVSIGTLGMERIPGLSTMKERFGSESLYGEGSSLQGRIEIYQYGISDVLRRPLGLGLGSSGMGNRAGGGAIQTVGDSGYIQIIAQFGWIGAGLFFCALWKIWKELGMRWSIGCQAFGPTQVNAFVPATRAILLAALVFLFVGDIFAGFGLLWVFLGRALSPHTDCFLLARQAMASSPASVVAAARPAESFTRG